MLKKSFCFAIAAIVASCAPHREKVAPPATAAKVDVARYIGKWHEVARLPAPFQRDNETAIAEYGLNEDGTVSVRNVAVRPDGSERDIRGTARILNAPQNTKLDVRFDTWFGKFIPESPEGNYWILHVDSNYQEAVVGTPSRKYLWILARDPNLSEARRDRLVQIAKERGYAVDRLIHHRR